jgi:hypothetical protein
MSFVCRYAVTSRRSVRWLLLAAGRIVGKRANIFIALRYWTNAA